MKNLFYFSMFALLINGCSNSTGKTNKNTTEPKFKTEEQEKHKTKNKNPQNIEDYYYLLPESYFMCDAVEAGDSKEFRKSKLTKKNIQGGYITANPQGFYTLEVALFKNRKNQSDIIAAFIQCGAGCMCNAMDFLTWDKETSTWKNITESIFPSSSLIEEKAGELEGVEFKLPEKGTTIKGYNEDGVEVITIKWDGEKFYL